MTDLKKHKHYLDVKPDAMVGTFEYITARAEVDHVDNPDDTADFATPRYAYVGETTVFWDSQVVVEMPDGRPVYLTEDGTTVVVEPDGRVAEVCVSITATAEYVLKPHSHLFDTLMKAFSKMPVIVEREAALLEVRHFIDTYFADAEKS